MKDSIHTYSNGQSYRTATTHQFKTHFSKFLREMNDGEYNGVVVTSYGRNVGVFLPHSRLSKKLNSLRPNE
jgi:antitoxin (DNA-binding transcriptional repressor) of toxin-antitoxin stability system